MDSPSDNFESLEKLLKLKRYEQPPPRYFNQFSGQVLARIELGEGRTSLWERFGFDLRPAFAAAAGMLACGLVVYGVATSDGAPDLTNGFGGYADASAGMGGVNHLLAPHSSSGNSTNPVADYGTSIDRKIFGGQILRTSFSPE